MKKIILEELYRRPQKIVVTAHRGFSGKFPENTLLAFTAAVRLGVDVLEFDLRGTKDHVPVILHDDTIDRTSNGKGVPSDYTVAELKRFNFSYWRGDHRRGRRTRDPQHPNVTIPTFQELLDTVPPTVGLNIQVCDATDVLLPEICRLYDAYDLYGRGYLTMMTFDDARKVRQINERIDLCILEGQGRLDRELLERTQQLGVRFLQPSRTCVTEDLCRMIDEMGFCANMFYSNADEDNRRFIAMGIRGILTDFPDVLKRTLRDLHRE